ncbi:predicted protein [Micromonas commoda]|uniref:U2A'/phosphoprotein 32 family A C-terminal domain-containing protein n=1 Tax=Micromonas commoda (strain RCC299 / NOUM17 / CCMP2709) TaxID=296587 RepID=C1FJ76_MICCC|nr:predicted protein [Micromonas commoda]ACO70541.1 predicted protein [Micromonas commoda]|eukprot:XP_002509283.1 predicted protein [Micromonas commoda]
MEQAIKQIADDFGQPVEELLSVVLDNMCQSQNVVGLDGLAACEELSVQGCGIASLDNFPNLQALRKLLLADNRIGGGLENLAKLTNLEELSIGGNKIASLDELKPLEGLKLTAIDLEGCPCADGSDTYRHALFAMFPTLIFLDGTDVDGNERLIDDDDDEDDEDEDEEEDFDDDDDEDEDDFDEDEDDEDDDEDEDDQVARLSAGIDDFDEDDDEEDDDDEDDDDDLGTANLVGPPMDDDEDEDDFEGGEDPESEDFDDEEDDDDEDEEEAPAKKARVD